MTQTKKHSPSSAPTKNILLLSAMAAGVLALSACGGSSNNNNNNPDPDPDPVGPGTIVYGVRDAAELVRFNAEAPDNVESVGNIMVGNGETVVGLDFRPGEANGELHAITSTGRSLIVDPDTAMVTEIQPITGEGTTPEGDLFGVDFNPAANALRIIDNDGLNLRVPPAALVAPAPAEAVNTFVDGRMGYLQGVTAAAYTNPNPPAMGGTTELFVIDTDNDTLYLQNPPNNGILVERGDLGVDASAAPGYDIVQVGDTNEHYALLTVGTTTSLYSLNATTGAATLIDALPAGTYKGLVVEGEGEEFAANERLVFALVEDGADYSVNDFLLDTTAGTLTPSGSFSVAGLPDGETLIGLDVRTTSLVDGLDTGYAVGRTGAIYSLIDDETIATQINATEFATLSFPPAPAPQALAGTNFGVDFNPRADLLRIVSDTGQNLRVNLQADRMIPGADGVPVARAAGFAFVDGTTRLASPAPQIVATAYRAAPTAGTFQFALDARDSSLYRVAVPNDGALVQVGPLGVDLSADAEQSLDISGADDVSVLAALRATGATQSTLYSVDLATGAATSLGVIGEDGPVNAVTARVEE